MKIDKRLAKRLILDTETTLNKEVFDIAWLVCDKYARIYEQREFLVQENFNKTFFYENKRPLYVEKIENLSLRILPKAEILEILLKDIATYDAQVYAYNSDFDQTALNGLWDYEVQMNDIFPYAYNIATQKSYLRENRRTEKGNMTMNAENIYQYISFNNDFEEEHTALSDCYIEMAILLKALRQHKKVDKTIKCNNAWIRLNSLYKRLDK